MKKILLLLTFCLIASNLAFAQEYNNVNTPISEQELKNILNTTEPPTEEQILEQLKAYSLTEEEAVGLYNQAKSRIKDAYETGSVEYFMELQNTPEFKSVQEKVLQDIQRYKELNEQYKTN